jgi:subtilisin-like proprotein convertase family protein
VALLVGALPAQAATVEFANDDGAIAIASGSAATPYPSTATVDDMFGPITDIDIHLRNITHDKLDDIDILLVAPSGASAWLLSDVCGNGTALVGDDITLDQDAESTFPSSEICDEGTFRPANYSDDPDITTPVADLDVFNGEVPNGTWQLFVRDDLDESGHLPGDIADGWAIEVTTGSASVLIPADQPSSIASAYPMEILRTST